MEPIKNTKPKFNSNVKHFFVKSTRKVNKINVLTIKNVQYIDKQVNTATPFIGFDYNDFATL